MSDTPEQLQNLLTEYVDGLLDAESASIVDAHLAANPAMRALVEQMKLDREAIRGLPRVNAPTDLSEDLRGRLERDQLLNADPIGNSRVRRFSPPMAAIAAMVMVGLGLGGIAYTLLANRPAPYLSDVVRDSAADKSASAPESPPVMTKTFRPAARSFQSDDATTQSSEVESSSKSDVPGSPSLTTTAPSAADHFMAAAVNSRAIDTFAAGGAAPAAKPSLPPTPALETANAPLPADVASALAGRVLNPARRSVAMIVDQRDALETLATVSRSARENGSPLEMSDRATSIAIAGQQEQQLQNLSNANAVSNVDVNASEVAVVARGVTPAMAASLQAAVRSIDVDAPATAYDIPSTLGVAQSLTRTLKANDGERKDLAPQWADLSAVANSPATTQATTRPFDLADDAEKLIDLYVVIRKPVSVPTTEPTSQPTTRPATMPAG